MNLVSYADESGTHDVTGQQPGSQVAGVCGYISEKEAWIKFCEEWKAVLGRYGVEVFHMSEFADETNGPNDRNWPYHGWDRDKKDHFIRELVPLARDYTMFAVGGFVDVRAYYALIPDWLKTDLDTPYHLCFQAFFDVLLETVRNKLEHPLDPGDQIAFFFDRQEQYKPLALRIYDQIKQLRDPENRMGSITFADKVKHPPLQAADLIAYRMRKVAARNLAGKPLTSEGSWDEALEARHNLRIGYIQINKLKPMIEQVIRARLEILAAALKKA